MTKDQRVALIRARFKKAMPSPTTWHPPIVKQGRGYVRATGHFISDFTVPALREPPIPLCFQIPEAKPRVTVSTKRGGPVESALTRMAKGLFAWNRMEWRG